MAMGWAALVSLLAVATFLWQDGENVCNDGERYTSGKPQPYPFHRRWCGWPKRLLQATSALSLVALGTLMGDWKHALLLVALPGFWFCAVHLTCVDAPSMLLGVVASVLWPHYPFHAIGAACLSGFIHERGPVFAALYAGHPMLLIGLVCAGWWRTAAAPDKDKLVGRGLIFSIKAHKPYIDWLDSKLSIYSLRAIPLLGAYFGATPLAWATLGVAWASRLVGTDGARFMLWGAPIFIRELPDIPTWMVFAHVMTFKRLI